MKKTNNDDSGHPKSLTTQNSVIGAYIGLKAEVLDYIETIPTRYRKRLAAAYRGNVSARKALDAKCLECMNFEHAPKRIRDCSCTTCPLHSHRPYQKSDT